MPFEMSGPVQSVVVQGKVYVGGGDGYSSATDGSTLMEYDISSGGWATLPPYRTCLFAIAVINNQLVLVGGWVDCSHSASKMLGVWRADRHTWTHPYPDMPTPRSRCSVIACNQWLVVAGGWTGQNDLSIVEVLNTDSKQWYAGPPTPTPWSNFKAVTIEDKRYLMGGQSTCVYSVSLPVLISHLNSAASSEGGEQIWKEIPGLHLTESAPLAMYGALLAVGGRPGLLGKCKRCIHLYQPSTKKWVKVGDLPSPCHSCTCVMITDTEVLVAGGWDGRTKTARANIAQIN